MKRMSLLVACGIVVSLVLSAPARADQQNKLPHGQHERQGAPRTPPRPPAATTGHQTVPRGDLRGDIANNARARVGLHAPDTPDAFQHH
ncbi:hypothetical protein [Burkholderia guangdongensis]|uniref:hypothetical protein n=1 Tax=Burkholderia guangdongensis TaxID=1792500 RepID=UPI0015C77E3F|nr:hypothetical protein [Burkholderia guangdongensis]